MKETTEPHPDAKMEGDATALMAAYGGDDAVISDLIQRGADLETKDAALMYACKRRKDALVRSLRTSAGTLSSSAAFFTARSTSMAT